MQTVAIERERPSELHDLQRAALAFPSLARKEPVIRGSVERTLTLLQRSACAIGPEGAQARHAARFILHVLCGASQFPFYLVLALETWDAAHRSAFADLAAGNKRIQLFDEREPHVAL